ncbi:hypothetical protein [Streptomyces sp. KN37]|uniref:hypothetical protein n=1 Tax=unclassified Streptomyces TaxID=2593676 RepID=UPI002A7555B9|nr:hypothetical protein [Streptomyces sp. KN37]WPO76654.1 hypothetical protein R9806_39125 [Streptomyces sp. KN37]
MTKLLLPVHVLGARITVGPVTAAASMFCATLRRALGDVWLRASSLLTATAAGVLALVIQPAQDRALAKPPVPLRSCRLAWRRAASPWPPASSTCFGPPALRPI